MSVSPLVGVIAAPDTASLKRNLLLFDQIVILDHTVRDESVSADLAYLVSHNIIVAPPRAPDLFRDLIDFTHGETSELFDVANN